MSTYHYTECGLDNIYLVNGYKISKSKNGSNKYLFTTFMAYIKQLVNPQYLKEAY